jgi:hypothetical protein
MARVPFLKPCIGSDGRACPTRGLTRHGSGRCETCRRSNWRARGSSTQRGYGAEHRRLREAWRPTVNAGGVSCARCRELIDPAEPWDLGHDDDDPTRTKYQGPEHVSCNRAVKAHAR